MLLLASADLTNALFGLGGVLLGAVIAATVTIWTQIRGERRERARDAESFRAGARLLLSELDQIDSYVERLSEQRRWEPPPQSAHWTATWETERRAMAGGVTDQARFREIANGFLVAVVLESTAGQRQGEELGGDELRYVAGLRGPVHAARSTLELVLSGAEPA